MSGGSWNYLCYKDVSELVELEEDIENMGERLTGLGYATDAAIDTLELLLTIRQFKAKSQELKDKLEDIWKAIEWWDSLDSGENEVKAALENYYRKEQATRHNILPASGEFT